MRKKDFIRIINEEITEFDFLSNDKHLKEQEDIQLLENKEFQKQFIIDSITRMRDLIKVDNSDTHISNDPDVQDEDYHNDLMIEANINVEYTYDPSKSPIKFSLSFDGERINYYTDYEYDPGDYHTQPYGKTWYTEIAWDDIKVELFTDEGDEINFTALDDAPNTIYKLFVRAYIESLIESKTDISAVGEKLPPYKPF
jgi:hypothetical protein